MAKRTKLTGSEVADIGSQISAVAQGSEALEGRLQKVLQSGQRMSRGLAAEFKKVHQRLITDARKEEATLARLHRQAARGENVSRSRIETLQKDISSRKRQIAVMDRVNTATQKESSLLSGLVKRIKDSISITGLFRLAWDLLVKGFENFIQLSQKWQSAMGQIAQQTGATANQFRQLGGVVGNMSGVFGSLEGAVDGIELAGQFTGELATSWREVNEITPEFARSILEVSRGFGLGVEKTVALRRNLDALGIAKTNDEFRAFSGRILDFSEAIGANAGQMMSDFAESGDFLAEFGNDAERTFREAAILANNFGFETRKIFEISKGFDTFGQASNKVNQLNAVLGTTISSYELMMEQDPARRVQMLTQAVADQGLSWGDLDRIQRRTLAEQMNLTEQEAARVFEMGATMEDIENDRQNAAEQQERDARTQRDNQQLMNRLLRRTQVVFETIQRAVQRVWNSFSRLLAPIFEVVNEEVIALIDHFRSWIDGARGTAEISTMVEDLSGWIREAFQWVRSHIPTWEELKIIAKDTWETAKEWGIKAWEVAKKVGETIVDITEWLQEQKDGWDDGTSSARQYWELIKAGGNAFLSVAEKIGEALDYALGPLKQIYDLVSGGEGTEGGGLLDTLTRSLNFLGGQGYNNPAAQASAANNGERQRILETREEVIQTIRQRAGQGASLDQITREMTQAGNENPLIFRVSRSGQRFSDFVRSEYESVPQSERGFVQPVASAPSATESSPEAAATATSNVARTTTSEGRRLEIVASDVNIDGRRVGRILFEIRERGG